MDRRLLIPLAAALLGAPAARAVPVLDQEQLVYDGGTSARTLPGYTIWQSFTAGMSGTLTEIDMGFFNDMSGTGHLEILAGDGSGGAVLQALDVPVVGVTGPGVTWNAWVVDVPITAGAQYTFNITPDPATLPDPYGVAIGAANPYPGGVMGIDDPSGSYRTDFDVVFRTFVSSDDIDVFRSPSPQGLEALPNQIGSTAASPYDDLPPSAPLLCYAVDDGAGQPAIIHLTRLPGGTVRIAWP